MKTHINPLVFLYLLLIIAFAAFPAHAQGPNDLEEQDPVLVGRISHVEGNISRYDPETDRWISTSREAPFGVDDLLRSDQDTRAEILLPNNTWIRIDGDTRLQLTALTPELMEIDLPFGNGRLYNKSSGTEINATTPFGRITAPPGSAFDLYVGESGVDIIAVRKSVFFFHNASGQRHEIRTNSAAISADTETVTAMADGGDPDWSAWNRSMDALWADRMASRGESTTYLPPELHSEAYALDKHGHWERVYYEGRYYRFWRPIQVSASWAPFSWGAWVVWHGDHVWVPHEPFGYVTHHYGNWIFTAGHWYWAPPVTHIMIKARLPLLHIGFGWYPGRVSWIHSGVHVGWIPLAPYEPYYTHRHWGRRSIAAAKWRHHHRHHVYKHRRHAVVIHRSHLYRSNDYRHARIKHISHTTIRKKFRPVRKLDRKVLKDYRRQEKHDRFHRHDRGHHRHPSKQIRNRRDRRQFARQFEQEGNPRRGNRRAISNRDVKPSDERRNIKKQRSGQPSPRVGKGVNAQHPSGKKRWKDGIEKAHRQDTSRRFKERRQRPNRERGNEKSRTRRDGEDRPTKQNKILPSKDRRIEKQRVRPSSPRLVRDPDRRRSDRRSSKISSGSERNRPKKSIESRRAQRHTRQYNNKEIRPPRAPSQVHRSRANRLERRSAPAQRQRPHSVGKPAKRRSPDRTVSRQHQRSPRSYPSWKASSGQRNYDRSAANRSHNGRHRSHRRY